MGEGVEDWDGHAVGVGKGFDVKGGSEWDVLEVHGREDHVVVTEGIF